MNANDDIIEIDKKPDVKKYTISLKKCISSALKFGSDIKGETVAYLNSVIDYEQEKVFPCLTLDHLINPWSAVYGPIKSVIVDVRIPLELVFQLGSIANGDIKSETIGVTQAHKIDMIQYRKIADIIHYLTINKIDGKWDIQLPRSKESTWDKQCFPDRYNNVSKYSEMEYLIKSFDKARKDGPLNIIEKEEIIDAFNGLLLMQSQTSVPYFNKDGKEEYIHAFFSNFPFKPKSLEFHKHTTINDDGVVETSVLVIQNIGSHNILVFYKYVDIWNDMREDFKNSVTKK